MMNNALRAYTTPQTPNANVKCSGPGEQKPFQQPKANTNVSDIDWKKKALENHRKRLISCPKKSNKNWRRSESTSTVELRMESCILQEKRLGQLESVNVKIRFMWTLCWTFVIVDTITRQCWRLVYWSGDEGFEFLCRCKLNAYLGKVDIFRDRDS